MLCPCEFAIHRGIIAGLRPARITNPQLLTRGLQIPEDKGNPQHRNMAIFLSLWICNPQGGNCGSVTRADYKSASY